MTNTITINELDMSKVIVTLANEDYFREFLDNIAHDYFLDMLVVYKQVVQSDDEGYITRTILNSELEEVGMTLQELDKVAKENTARMFPATLEDFCGLKVITNEVGNCGASAILYSNLVEQVADELESDIFLIPSSIHEFIAIPTEGFNAPSITKMIREANGFVVQGKEILSSHPYVYRRDIGELTVA